MPDFHAELARILESQRRAFLETRPESLSMRRDRIRRAIALLVDNADSLCAAMNADFGGRSPLQSKITDIAAPAQLGRYCLGNLRRWAAPERRKLPFPLGLAGAKAHVRYEPKGVIGILSPWNFPVNLSFGPLMQVLAAGNRAMIKPSEATPVTSALLVNLCRQAFDETEVAVVEGGADVAQAFSAQPFDHLVFTGSTATGRKVMQAAASNLVPVTLELGGKSPAVIGRNTDLGQASDRIVIGKLLNAGQICIAPDYLMVPTERMAELVADIEAKAGAMYPMLRDNPDYAAIASDKHFARLQDLVDDARSKGARIVSINPGNEDVAGANARKMPLTLVLDVTDEMQVMREEIFGPVLPILAYRDFRETIDRINAGDHPLALYYFGSDRHEREHLLERTSSGGVTIDDIAFHVMVEDLPFGGIGASGTGAYHGREGFREFSHARSIYRQSRFDLAGLVGLKPPYGDRTRKTVASQLKKR